MFAFGDEREVDHHDRVLLDDADEQHDRDHRHDGQFRAGQHHREQRAARSKQEGQRQQRRQPDAAALAKSNSYVVRVVNKDGQPEPRTIKVGLNNGSNVEVLEGLREGELVVVGEVTAGEKSNSSNQRGPMGPMMGGPRR